MGRFELEILSTESNPNIKASWITGDPDHGAGSVSSLTDDVTGVTTYIISVRNVTGITLPYTGGVGTNLIYLFGIVLIVLAGAGLLLKLARLE